MVGRVIAILVLVLLASGAFGSATGLLRPDSVEQALLLQDGEQAQIGPMYVDMILDNNYIIVRDVMAGSVPLAVYTNGVQISPFSTLLIRGRMATVQSQSRRVLIADEIFMYTTSKGDPAPPIGWMEPEDWPYIAQLPQVATAPSCDHIPPVPDIPVPVISTPLFAPAGSIAAAKIGGGGFENIGVQSLSVSSRSLSSTPAQLVTGPIELTGKVITGVFYESTPKFFYIQDPDCPNGIKVIPSIAVPVESGNIVTIKGTVVASGSSEAECYIDANQVTCTGSMLIPNPMGLIGRATAGGEFGAQQALYLKSPDVAVVGNGLNAVGSRVRVWGKVTSKDTSGDHSIYYVDDGSGLTSTTSGGTRDGLKVVYWNHCGDPSLDVDDYLEGVTGVLGAEMSADDPALAVPVVRVPCNAASTVVMVKVGATTPDGETWDTAYPTVQDGIDAASAMTPKGEVWVAADTYYENITMADGVRVYGGFAGTETMRQQRNWTTNETILDGQQSGSVVTAGSSVDSSAWLDGFTITNGYGTYVSTYGWCGGGILCNGGSPVIRNNNITANSATDAGGAIACVNSSQAQVCNNTIRGNITPSGSGLGGGIYCGSCSPAITSNTITFNDTTGYYVMNGGGIALSNSSAIVANNTIYGHEVWSRGGGIYCNGGSPTISGNSIGLSESASNWAYEGGGIYCDSSPATISNNNHISFNAAYIHGGGICCAGAGSTISSNTIVSNSSGVAGGGIYCDASPALISGNDAISSNHAAASGGGIACYRSAVTIADNMISSNYVDDGSAPDLKGGGIYIDNYDVQEPYTGTPIIRDNTIVANHAPREGGGLFLWRCKNTQIERNWFVSNQAVSPQNLIDGQHGGAIATEFSPFPGTGDGSVQIVNNLFANNKTPGTNSPGGGAIQAYKTNLSAINNTFVNNDAQPGIGGAILLRYETTALIVNNIFYKNRAQDYDQSTSEANSVAWEASGFVLTPPTILYCCGMSEIDGSNSDEYHYGSNFTPGAGCYLQRLVTNDVFLSEAETDIQFLDLDFDYHLQNPGPSYTPRNCGHNQDAPPYYDNVPLTDLNNSVRPDSTSGLTDMGAYEAQ